MPSLSIEDVTSSAVTAAATRVARAPSVALIAFAPFVAIVVRPLSAVLLSYELLPRHSRRCFFSPRRRSKPSAESSGYCSWKLEALREHSFAHREIKRIILFVVILWGGHNLKVFKDGRDVELEGKRKPDTEFFMEAFEHLKVDLANCIFVDDRFLLFLFIYCTLFGYCHLYENEYLTYCCSCFILKMKGPWGALSAIPEKNVISVNSQGGSVFSASGDSCAYCWDVETGKVKMVFKGHLDYLHCIVARNSSNQAIKDLNSGCKRKRSAPTDITSSLKYRADR
ncbi:hypothetical protein Ahy_A09g044916 [Arachis hypogaea]|uniref:Uncharacterized protein n=1 Tax=Arachis hypogaea TaxID=3818 RepID=A0A445BL40_ARAHY|nr:hypothetical protein Ahy_A09g044916 [Arachis hypogaea]